MSVPRHHYVGEQRGAVEQNTPKPVRIAHQIQEDVAGAQAVDCCGEVVSAAGDVKAAAHVGARQRDKSGLDVEVRVLKQGVRCDRGRTFRFDAQ